MSDKVVISKEKLDNLANAISVRSGSGVTLRIDEMTEAVSNLSGSSKLQEKTVTPGATDQIVTPDQNYDGLESVVVRGDTNLLAKYIAEGTTIFGVQGIAVLEHPFASGEYF